MIINNSNKVFIVNCIGQLFTNVKYCIRYYILHPGNNSACILFRRDKIHYNNSFVFKYTVWLHVILSSLFSFVFLLQTLTYRFPSLCFLHSFFSVILMICLGKILLLRCLLLSVSLSMTDSLLMLYMCANS